MFTFIKNTVNNMLARKHVFKAFYIRDKRKKSSCYPEIKSCKRELCASYKPLAIISQNCNNTMKIMSLKENN